MNIPDIATLPLEISALLIFSAVCSGLNIALMSLDLADLRRKAKLGNKDAKRVFPLRKNTHLSLAAILLTNIGAVSASSLVLEQHLNGVLAGLISTLLIVIFGEILPQAYFAPRALALSAWFAPILRGMIILTYPISKPLQLLLDALFGRDQGSRLQSRRELGVLISEHMGQAESELDDDEVDIIRGALGLSEKKVSDIMTPISNVYLLAPNTIVDDKRIDEIKAKGWSRIPVINKARTICFGILLMKDLVDVNFDEEAVHIQDLPLHATQVVGSKTALDTLLRKFIKSGVHLAPVELNDKIVGVVTIEDLLEEIVGHEIEDETDRSKRFLKQ
jgi:CBS domain containing-hemolysin-like protein